MRGITYSLRLKITEKLKKRVKYNSAAQRPTFLCYTHSFVCGFFFNFMLSLTPCHLKLPKNITNDYTIVCVCTQAPGHSPEGVWATSRFPTKELERSLVLPAGAEGTSHPSHQALDRRGCWGAQRGGTSVVTLLGLRLSTLLRGNMLVEEATEVTFPGPALRSPARPPGDPGQAGRASRLVPGSCVLETPSLTVSEPCWGHWPWPQRWPEPTARFRPQPTQSGRGLTRDSAPSPALGDSEPQSGCPQTVDGIPAIGVRRFHTHTHAPEIPRSGLS